MSTAQFSVYSYTVTGTVLAYTVHTVTLYVLLLHVHSPARQQRIAFN